ncbi:MAG: acyl-CoA reductase, partial [Flaviaesturariibacter sp.]|nr:acyl-CoA reductase [Flaviaesturariibacter sp.]
MNLQERCDLLIRLGIYMAGKDEAWLAAKDKAHRENAWFIPEFIELASRNIASTFLQPQALESFASSYNLPQENPAPKQVGLVLAGNIPLVGFHDVMCVFIT